MLHQINTIIFPTLTYQKIGKGPPLVLIHGFPLDHNVWGDLIQQLSKDYLVIAPDLPLAGGSTYNGNDLTIAQMADSIYAIIQHEKLEKVVVAGHSMGGYTVLAYAEKYENSLAGICLIHSSAYADTEDKKELRRKTISLINKGGREGFIKQMIPALFSEDFRTNNQELIKQQILEGLKLDEHALVSFYNAMINRSNRTKVLGNADFPVAWVLGKEDNITSLNNVSQQTCLATVNFVYVYNDTAHMSMLENCRQLGDDLSSFCSYCYRSINK